MAHLSRAVAELLQIHASGFQLYQQDTIEPYEHTDKLPEINSLHFIRVPSPECGVWAPSGFAMCRMANESDFDSVVSRKEKKLSAYRSAVPTVWLLVVVELFEAGELVNIADSMAPFSVRTDFDRVFAFHWLTGRVCEIPVIRSEQ